MADLICQNPSCRYKFYSPNSGARWCPKCRTRMHRQSELERCRKSEYREGKKFSGTRIITVIECPKDDPSDEFPPFMPEGSTGWEAATFSYESFMDSVKMKAWPLGMKVRLSMRKVIWGADGKKVDEYRRWYYYTIPYGNPMGVIATIERDVKRFDVLAREKLKR